MKIKNDFVTNSSSMSFIVYGNSTRKLAKKMLEIIFEDWKSFNNPANQRFKKQILKSLDSLKKDENIMIPFSCNYPTFISLSEDRKIFVDTCTNHNWVEIGYERSFGEGSDDKEYFDECTKQNTLEFVNIESGKRGSKADLEEEENNEKYKGAYDE